jgi:oligogalacturonide transport system substrate-binding protein
MIKSSLTKLLALIGSALLIINTTACSLNKETANTDTEKHRISFAWWGNGERNSYTLDGVDGFEALNPDITVNSKYGNWNGYSKRQNIYMKSNQAPDVMQINFSWLSEYSADGEGFYDLNTLADYIDFSNYDELELSYGMINGKLNAIPIAFNSQSLYYNMDIFAKYGLDSPKTWDDFFTAAKVMRADGIYPLGLGDKALFFFTLSYLEQTTGHKACDAQGNLILTKDDIKYMLTFYKRLIDEEVIPPVEKYNLNYFLTSQVAGTMSWVSDANQYCSTLANNGINVAIGDYPTTGAAQDIGWYIKPATMYAISKTTTQPEAAARLLDYLVNSPEMARLQKTDKGIPISDSAQAVLLEDNLLDGLVYEANQHLVDNQEKMSVMSPILETENVYLAFKENATYYIYGKKSIDAVADMIYSDFYK